MTESFDEKFDIVICMENALPHMLTKEDLETVIRSITGQMASKGIFVASIRDYDELLKQKLSYSPPYIHHTDQGRNVSFQTWAWDNEHYKLVQYIIEDEETLRASKFEWEYRATCRQELTDLLLANGCTKVTWKFPEETGFYQPIVVTVK